MDKGRGFESMGVGVGLGVHEPAQWRGIFTIEKFDADIEWYAKRQAKRIGSLDDYAAVEKLFRGEITWDKLPAHIQLAADREMRKQNRPFDVGQTENGLLNTGINALWNILYGNTSAANTGSAAAGANAVFNNAQARLAVGDSTTAFAATQTWLQASPNVYAQGMDATYPSVTNQTIAFKATITGSNADYAWNEFCADNCNGSNATSTTKSGGSALNRAVSSQGTKASGQSWALTLNVTLS